MKLSVSSSVFDLFLTADDGLSLPARGARCHLSLHLAIAPKALGLVTLHRMNMHTDTTLATHQGTAPRDVNMEQNI